jgi:hypothetical protein
MGAKLAPVVFVCEQQIGSRRALKPRRSRSLRLVAPISKGRSTPGWLDPSQKIEGLDGNNKA